MASAPEPVADLDRAYAALEAIRVLSVAALHDARPVPVGDSKPAAEDALAERRIAVARKLYAERRLRDGIFPALRAMFGEPVWDMLLDLFVHEEAGEATTVSQLCTMSGVAPTTALRYVLALEQRGALVSEPHPTDRRKRLIWLAAHTHAALCKYLDRLCDAPAHL